MQKDKTGIILEVYNQPPKFINLALESQYIAVIYVNVTYAVANNKECRAKSSRDFSVRRFAVQPRAAKEKTLFLRIKMDDC